MLTWDWQKLDWQMLLMKRLLLSEMMKKPVLFLLLGLASLLQPSCAYRDPALALPHATADLLLPQPPLFPAPCPLPVSSQIAFTQLQAPDDCCFSFNISNVGLQILTRHPSRPSQRAVCHLLSLSISFPLLSIRQQCNYAEDLPK